VAKLDHPLSLRLAFPAPVAWLIVTRDELKMKSAIYLLGGSCCLLVSLAFGCFLIWFLSHGAGLSSFADSVSAGSVIIGLIPTLALIVGSLISFATGAYLCVRAFEGVEQTDLRASAERAASPHVHF
jgi:hypothetical protein